MFSDKSVAGLYGQYGGKFPFATFYCTRIIYAYMRKDSQNDVLETLSSFWLISFWKNKRGAILKKNLFPELLKVGR
jgi:hypothetical protein